MKILLIDVNYGKSSTGKIVYDLAQKLNESDTNIAKVLYGRGDKIYDDNVGIRVSSVIEVYFHALMTRLTGLNGFFSFFSTRKIISEIKKFKPDVIHLHELHGYYVNYSKVLDFIKQNNLPVVWTFHCEFAYTGKCGYSYDCEKWKTECNSCPQIKEYPASLYFDFTRYMFNKKKSDFLNFKNIIFVTPSKWLAKRVKQSFLAMHDIRVVHNGIDTEKIFYPKFGFQKKSDRSVKTIISVAPDIMSDRKGGKWIIELAKRFDDSFRFILVGVVGEIEDLPSNVVAINRTNNQSELADFYSSADLFLICSKRENFPTTCLESLACGTPVMGFDEGGTAETAPNGLGVFVPFGNLELLEYSVRRFFDGDISISSSDCREFASKFYSKNTMFNNYISIYNEILAKKG